MFTMKLFDGLVAPRRDQSVDRDLLTWARTEYKKDAEFAYNYMITHGAAPAFGVVR